MDKDGHVRGFSGASYRAESAAMAARREGVFDRARQTMRETHRLDPLVDVTQNRGSHNAMIAGETPGIYVLQNGIALPIVNMFDGTGSTARFLETFFQTAERGYDLLHGARTRYNTQLATGVVQDVYDVRTSPVVQLSQFESDERSASQVRMLLPAGDGGDAAEDYDLGLASGLTLFTDIGQYGLKGYFLMTADDVGRGSITKALAKKHLGQDLPIQSDRLSTKALSDELLQHWHLFILLVGRVHYSPAWWEKNVGPGRVIQVDRTELLAEVRAGLIFVTESVDQPNVQSLGEFLRSGEQTVTDEVVMYVWETVQQARQHFGAQSQLPGYDEIPLPGDKFAHWRHTWPIGHPRAGENVTPDVDERAPTKANINFDD